MLMLTAANKKKAAKCLPGHRCQNQILFSNVQNSTTGRVLSPHSLVSPSLTLSLSLSYPSNHRHPTSSPALFTPCPLNLIAASSPFHLLNTFSPPRSTISYSHQLHSLSTGNGKAILPPHPLLRLAIIVLPLNYTRPCITTTSPPPEDPLLL